MIISQFLLHYCYIYVEKSIYLAHKKKQKNITYYFFRNLQESDIIHQKGFKYSFILNLSYKKIIL